MADSIRPSPNPPGVFVPITPSNSTFLEGFQWLVVSVAGNLELRGKNQSSSLTIAVIVGQLIPFGSGYVRTNTTATVGGLG
jgi:hypothetical protein